MNFEINNHNIDKGTLQKELPAQEVEKIETLVLEILGANELDDMGKLALASKIVERRESPDSETNKIELSEQGKIELIKRVGEEIKKTTQTPQYKKDLEKIKEVMGTGHLEGQGKMRKQEDEWRRQHDA